ncbi:MAG: hypothetical protein J0I54_12650 [Bosea sp.]|uniref:hypothetical protein n=1 Tax=unclassified Bosea (in: a-proteobacteria) TaxID=2653178 RepID=UPI00095AC1D7|nr:MULTISPECIES: hypothetical protein [unclassified Bosea (in: a-proteobacteria)]MBN9457470.1 hypothetical protein [Bosea sp. (in: a-proteobacteria)]OJV09563.1 MAG: hypothetical protein BGO20_02465 [Bosea sp. 67-29]
MAPDNHHLRAVVVADIAQIMVAIGQDSGARHAAALERFPGCPEPILWAAECEADRLIEARFLAPLAERFADLVAAREMEEAANRPASGGSRQPAMSGDGGRSSSSHLDADVPF